MISINSNFFHSRAVLFTLSKQAKALEANKLCLQINKKLQALKPPPTVQDQIDNNYLHSKACKSGFNDPEELLPLCYKCSNYSSHLNENSCPTCHQDFNFSFVSFGESAIFLLFVHNIYKTLIKFQKFFLWWSLALKWTSVIWKQKGWSRLLRRWMEMLILSTRKTLAR